MVVHVSWSRRWEIFVQRMATVPWIKTNLVRFHRRATNQSVVVAGTSYYWFSSSYSIPVRLYLVHQFVFLSYPSHRSYGSPLNWFDSGAQLLVLSQRYEYRSTKINKNKIFKRYIFENQMEKNVQKTIVTLKYTTRIK